MSVLADTLREDGLLHEALSLAAQAPLRVQPSGRPDRIRPSSYLGPRRPCAYRSTQTSRSTRSALRSRSYQYLLVTVLTSSPGSGPEAARANLSVKTEDSAGRETPTIQTVPSRTRRRYA